MTDSEDLKKEAAGYYKDYQHYNRILRVWLVTFGIGGPVLLLVEQSVRTKLICDEVFEWVLVLFLSGVFLQVLLTFLNKFTAYIIYDGKQHGRTSGCLYKACDKISNYIGIDMGGDFLTIVAFTWGAFLVADAYFP